MAEDSATTTEIAAQLERGNTARAIELCRAALLTAPSATLASLLGRALVQTRDFDGAKTAFARAIELEPKNPKWLANMGNFLRERGAAAEAVEVLERSLVERPDSARTLTTLGAALNDVGRFFDARSVLVRALKLEPGLDAATVRLARSLTELEGRDTAIRLLESAVAIKPASGALHVELGSLLHASGRADEARSHFESAFAADPRSPQICARLGDNLRSRGEVQRARELLERSLVLDPGLGEAHVAMAFLCAELGEDAASDEHFERARKVGAVTHEAESAWLFFLLYRESATPAMLRAAHEEVGSRIEGGAPPEPFSVSRPPARPLRVGYASADFRGHVVALFMEHLIREHDRTRVEIELVSSTTRHDEITARFAALAPLHAFEGCTTNEFVTRVRALDLDLLVDLSGHTDGHRLAALAARVARVQATYLGYPATTGLSAIDYRITDALSDPPGSEDEFVEQLYRLPEVSWAYAPSTNVSSSLPVDHGDDIVFGCFNRRAKLSAGVLGAWRSILEQRPRARLILKARGFDDPGAQRRVADALGADRMKRVTFKPWVPSARGVYEAYREVDVALDTSPYNGTTTTCDALWMGVGVITLRGSTAPSRVGNALLSAVGLDDLAASDVPGYVRAALALADDSDRRRELRSSLRPRLLASPLGNPSRLARQLEDAFVAMTSMGPRSRI